MAKLAQIEVFTPQRVAQKLEELLLFDARFVDVTTRQELLRLFPRLVHIRRAFSGRYNERGCMCCKNAHPPDPRIAIAIRLRRRRWRWSEIYRVVIPEAQAPGDRERFSQIVRNRLKRPEATPRNGQNYGAGGMCACCVARLTRDLRNRVRKMHSGRNVEAEIAALTREYDLAQWLLGT